MSKKELFLTIVFGLIGAGIGLSDAFEISVWKSTIIGACFGYLWSFLGKFFGGRGGGSGGGGGGCGDGGCGGCGGY